MGKSRGAVLLKIDVFLKFFEITNNENIVL